MAIYRVMPEHQERWGECNGSTIVTDEEIREMARVWEVSTDELLEQAEVIDTPPTGVDDN